MKIKHKDFLTQKTVTVQKFRDPHLKSQGIQYSSQSYLLNRQYPSNQNSSDPFNNFYHHNRPSSHYSQELSFEGLSSVNTFSKFNKSIVNLDYILDLVTKKTGFDAHKLLKSVKKNLPDSVKLSDNSIQFKEAGIFSRIKEAALYPIVQMPFDIANFSLSSLSKLTKKFQGKDSHNIFDSLYNSKILKNNRLKQKSQAEFNALKGLVEQTDKILKDSNNNQNLIDQKLFSISQKSFNPKIGKYNSVHERSLNRIVSGVVSTFFLANDAYNLASLCENNKDTSTKERKARRNQELTRIGMTAYLQLITLGALTKVVNSTKFGSALTVAATVLFSESISRLLNGKPITFISKDTAKKINAKSSDHSQEKNTLTNTSIIDPGNDISFDSTKNNKIKPLNTNNNTDPLAFKQAEKSKQNHKPENKKDEGLFTLENFFNFVGISILSGLTATAIRKTPAIQKFTHNTLENISSKIKSSNSVGLQKFSKDFDDVIKKSSKNQKTDPITFVNELYNKAYKNLTEKNYTISNDDFLELTKKLKQNGFDTMSDNYSSIIDSIQKNNAKNNPNFNPDIIELGKVNKSIKPLVDVVISIPSFFKKALLLPFRISKSLIRGGSALIDKFGFKKMSASINNFFDFTDGKSANKDCKTIMTNALRDLTLKARTLSDSDFKKYVQKNTMQAFNNQNMSTQSNADLALVTKLISSGVASWFLVADNYNMVMLKSDGEDQAGAIQKAKERIVQRISSLLYSSLFINLFNTTFEAPYHASLLGMSAVTAASQTCMEVTSRASIGMPILNKSKEEILELERKNQESKGFKGSYYRFMSKLTGKKALSSKVKPKVDQKQ